MTVVRGPWSVGRGRDRDRDRDRVLEQSLGALAPLELEGLSREPASAEKKFKTDLANKWGIEFTGLFTFANVPLGRFKQWLEKSGNFEGYMEKLVASFNPDTIDGLMCRSMINISWDGYLYDCDFNMAAGLPYSEKPMHISRAEPLKEGSSIMTDNYCFACTAGAGFT